MALDERKGVWKNARGKGRISPKGQQVDETALRDIHGLLNGQPTGRDRLIENLHLIQDAYGHLSSAHLLALSEEMHISRSEVYEVATFYAHFDIVKGGESPPPALTIRVCDSLSCEMAGAKALKYALEQGLDPESVRVVRAPCMGRCDTAPVLELGRNHIEKATLDKVLVAINKEEFCPRVPEYESYATYRDGGGYDTLIDFRSGAKTVDQVQDEILSSGLRGMGGAGFPSGKKWSFVRAETGPRYLAVNADEGEPGTFKDRHFLGSVPHLFLEGMLIAAWAVEAEKCFIYLRDEYPEILQILRREIAELEASGLVRKDYIDLRRGAGAYICGEESAMIESIEGKRGIPRHRPPFVANVGLFGRPTLVHNVETLHWIARICREGEEVFSAFGANGRKGMRSYSVSGRVKCPGVKIASAGVTVRELIALSGGMCDGHIFKAYQPGGPSSGILPASLDRVPLDFDSLQPHGTFIGSAAVVVMSDHDSIRSAALNMLRFFEDESCGQCTPCRAGCEKAVKLMSEPRWNQPLLSELCETMVDASICGLGQAAPNPIRLVMKHFNDEIS